MVDTGCRVSGTHYPDIPLTLLSGIRSKFDFLASRTASTTKVETKWFMFYIFQIQSDGLRSLLHDLGPLILRPEVIAPSNLK